MFDLLKLDLSASAMQLVRADVLHKMHRAMVAVKSDVSKLSVTIWTSTENNKAGSKVF